MNLSLLATKWWTDTVQTRLDAFCKRGSARRARKSQLLLECLEERWLPSVVTNTNDSGAGSLRDAIVTSTPSGGTVTFQNGLTGAITLTSGPIAIAKNLTITGPGAAQVAVSGNSSMQIFTVSNGDTVSISGLTLENGDATGTVNGGAINNAGTLTLTSCTVSNNQASLQGGGIFSSGSLILNGCTIASDSAFSGGGIYNTATLSVISSVFSNNATAGSGGGIANFDSSSVSVGASTFTSNTSNNGGGAIANAGTTTATITGSFFSEDETNNGGGSLDNMGSVSVFVGNSTFANNTAGSHGGSIDNTASATLTITNSVFSNDSAGSGGRRERYGLGERYRQQQHVHRRHGQHQGWRHRQF